MEGDGALPTEEEMKEMIQSKSRWAEVEEAVACGFDVSTVLHAVPLLSFCIIYNYTHTCRLSRASLHSAD